MNLFDFRQPSDKLAGSSAHIQCCLQDLGGLANRAIVGVGSRQPVIRFRLLMIGVCRPAPSQQDTSGPSVIVLLSGPARLSVPRAVGLV